MPAPINFRLFNHPGDFVLSVGLRGVQVLFTIVVLGTSGGSVDAPWGGGYFAGPACGLAVSILNLIWLVFSLFFYRLLFSIVVTVVESLIAVLWIVSFGLLASNFAGVNCSLFDDDDFFSRSSGWKGCHAGQAAAAFSFLLFALHVTTLALHVVYSFIPLNKVDEALIKSPTTLLIGAIFPLSETAGTKENVVVGDLEAGQLSIEKDQTVADETIPVTHSEPIDEPPVVVAHNEVPTTEELPPPEARN